MAARQGPTAADVLLRILYEHYYITRTKDGTPIAVARDNPCVMLRMTGHNGLRAALARDGFAATGKAMGGQALADAIALAEGMATAPGKPIAEPALRIALKNGAIYLDLGRLDGRAVEVVPGRWRVVDRPPVLFARSRLTSELPEPVPGTGSLDAVRPWFNVAGADAWALFIACRIASMFPGITHPVEVITGQAGSAKTTTTRLMADWVDPAPAMTPVPRDGRTWAAMALARYCQPIDNVSYILPWWSDLLCKSVSGDGWIDRALYTDMDTVVAFFRNVVILNGIGMGLRGDLADRTVMHKLVRPERYAGDLEIAAAWRQAHPMALAWLLDRLAETMADMGHVPAVGASRLVEFQQIVACVDRRWGTRAMDYWGLARREVLEDVTEDDQVAVAIIAAIRAPWSGTSSELLDMLATLGGLPASPDGAGKRSWSPRMISERVDRCSGALEAIGWQVARWRENRSGKRCWGLTPPGSTNGQFSSSPSFGSSPLPQPPA